MHFVGCHGKCRRKFFEYNLSVLGHVPLFDGIPEDKYTMCCNVWMNDQVFSCRKDYMDIGNRPNRQEFWKIQIISYDEAGN